MNLEKLYDRVFDAISSLDYESIWQGFQPLKFALYDDENCFFDGAYIEKSDDFCANTAILYRGEQIAIWRVTNEPDIPVLASEIVHEMFLSENGIVRGKAAERVFLHLNTEKGDCGIVCREELAF